jgi:serine/threonine-protein kinase
MLMDTTLSDPMVGRLIDGRYAVEAFIAHGGMAGVYLATDTRLERRVAVKVLHAHLADDRDTLARFDREARAAARLSHPSVVAVYDQGVDSGRPFLVMEYVPGANLRHVLRDRGKLTVGEALTVMDHVLAALAAAHSAGLIHRDVKPENVLLTADGRVKVADFGLARAVAGSTVTTTGSVLLGTAAYLAPEQFQHGTADARSDVYSAGVVFFELLTGKTPFDGDSAYAILHRHANEDVPAPSSRASDIPPQVDALVTWATSRDPQQRPSDAAELHASLIDVRERLGLHAAVPALPVAMTTRLQDPASTTVMAGTSDLTQAMAPPGATVPPAGGEPRPRRRRGPWIAALIGVLVIVAAAVLGWYFAVGRYTHAPHIVGQTQANATRTLRDAGLQVRIGSSVHSLKYPAGEVARESPSGGARISHGQTVTLQMSLGPLHHTLQSYGGDSVSDVTTALGQLNISVSGQRQVYNSRVKKGAVVGTIPSAGTDIAEGKSVVLRISRGPAPVMIPNDLNGASEQAASSELAGLGLTATVSHRYSGSVPSGEVISTHPGAGKTRHKGDSIELVVSQGPRPAPVPNVVGEAIDQAVKDIGNHGFHANPVEVFPGGPGQVLQMKVDGQDINPGQEEPRGTTIELDYY